MWPFKRLKYEPNVVLKRYIHMQGEHYEIEFTGRYYLDNSSDKIFVEVKYLEDGLLWPEVKTVFVSDEYLQFYQVCGRKEWL